ncbi:hypothetical protein Bca4012_026562 [Brassica carinata]
MKNVLTKHRHGREHDRGEQHIPDDHDLDEEEAEDYEVGQSMFIPYLTARSLPVTFWHESFSCRGYFPTKVSEPIKAGKPERGPNTSHGHEALPHHARPLEYEQFRVNIERDRGLEEGPAAQLVEKLEQHSSCEEERKM